MTIVEFSNYQCVVSRRFEQHVAEILDKYKGKVRKRHPELFVCGPDVCAGGGYFLTGGQPKRAFERRIAAVIAAKGGRHPLQMH